MSRKKKWQSLLLESQSAKLQTLNEQIQQVVRKEFDNQETRKQTVDGYSKRLENNDDEISGFIQNIIKETISAYHTTVSLYFFSYCIAFLILASGLILLLLQANANNKLGAGYFIVAVLLVIGSGLWIVVLQNRSPVKSIRFMVNNLAKLNVIFAGYIRQIHQVDTVFEGILKSGQEIDPETAEKMLNHLQDAMAEAMQAISLVTGEIEE